MSLNCPTRRKFHILSFFLILFCSTCFAGEDLFRQARTLQREGNFDDAIKSFKAYLTEPLNEDEITKQKISMYTEALVQMMNTYQSKGAPEACITDLQKVFDESPVLQEHCQRDFHSVMGYALSRTEKMKEAEEMTLKVFTMPLRYETPERYFRDYAYAAAVFYSNPEYQDEVIDWCEEAMLQAQLCKNTSGRQWVTAMLGSLYKRNGHINKALELFLQSKEEAQEKEDELGVLNSLHSLVDLFLYWDVPEYADQYASEAIMVESNMKMRNPMVSAQTYINKGRALYQSGEMDSISFYTEKAKELCKSLPYNSGMVDVDLLHGIYLTELGGDSLHLGIQELRNVTRQGTSANRAKAFHQLAQTYLKQGKSDMAEMMLDSMYGLVGEGVSQIYIQIDYEPIIDHYLKRNDRTKAEEYVRMMLEEQQALKEKRVNFNLVEAIVDRHIEKKSQELKIAHLKQTNQSLWFTICSLVSLVIISVIVAILLYQRKQHRLQMEESDRKHALLVQKVNQTKAEKDKFAQEISEIMNEKDNRQEIETLTPSVLQKKGESKFRQRFELLYPLFLPRLREKVPSITRREELLCMLIILKQDNKEIAELLAIAPRSVLMLRHRFRQKIGLDTEYSLENFIGNLLESKNFSTDKVNVQK